MIRRRRYTSGRRPGGADWNNTQAGTIFEQIFTPQQGNFVGVAAANDGLGGAVASVLERNMARRKDPGHWSGRDGRGPAAGSRGHSVQHGLQGGEEGGGRRCRAGNRARHGRHGSRRRLATDSVQDTETGQDVKSSSSSPRASLKENVKDVIADGYTTKEKVCTTPELQQACAANGIS